MFQSSYWLQHEIKMFHSFIHSYLDSFEETSEEGAECFDAVVQLERGFVVAEVKREFTAQ